MAVAFAAVCTLAGGNRVAAQDEPEYIDFGLGGVAGYNSFDDLVATSTLADDSTVEGLVLEAEDGSRATLALDVAIGPLGFVDGAVVATIDDGNPETEDEVVEIPVAGRANWRDRTLISPVPAEEGEEPATATTTFHDNAFGIVARRPAEGEEATTPRLRIAGRERYSESTAVEPTVDNGGFRTAMGLELPGGRQFRGFALVDGLGTAEAAFLTDAATFHALGEGGRAWVGDAQVDTDWAEAIVPGGLTRLELNTRPGGDRPRPGGDLGGGRPGHGPRIEPPPPPPPGTPGTGRYVLNQMNLGYRGRIAGQIVLPVLEEGVTPPPPIELERIPKSILFATPAALTTVEYVNALPTGPGGKH